ncbi:unnamed protein product [Rhizophagus irregularis]|uniref:AAA+ ATPase domain-containing protein n=2 Tax=Rhizophagus irregularis TaxID=588596 RepID=A0A915YQ74_9GLOM|nr:unnamed protein product [Rhizophagus irregularis]CAB5309041.1 unnamed protein product [Rhizophagus irregularis]
MSVTRSLRHLSTSPHNCMRPYFYRHQEIKKFKEAFSYNIPRIHVILGPPNSGKTTLIRDVAKMCDVNPLIIDCLTGSFDTPENLYCSISAQFRQFFANNSNLIKNCSVLLNTLSYKQQNNFKITNKDVIELFEKIDETIETYSLWKNKIESPPLLIFDEAHLFSKLTKSKEGESLLISFLNWLVTCTKQNKFFHVVLTSSDSFFINWITKILLVPYVTPYIVGDLSIEEAEEYFELHVLPNHDYEVCGELEGQFDNVCSITGTRMLTIDHYVDEYKVHRGKFENFSEYRQELDWLNSGLYPKKLRLPGKFIPSWNRDDFIDTMNAIIRSPGFILENNLINEIGHEAVSSLIEYNFLHRRPTNNYANDIINPPDEVILTAISKPSIFAMENLLKRINN